MAKFIDLTGMRFGRLTVKNIRRTSNGIMWECLCDCGGATVTRSANLRSGHTQSCGCLRRERTSMSCKKDLSGQVFGKLTVIERISSLGEQGKYKCRCSCGNYVEVLGHNLATGATKSCGCIRRMCASKLNFSHGQHGSRLYHCWRNMLDRCENKNNKEYSNYGLRNISVCPEWHDFRNFYDWAMANGYQDELTIERLDVNSGYSPGNCTWATMYVQARNRRNNRKLTFDGKTMIITDWAKELGVSEATLRKRLKRGRTNIG